MRFEDWLPSLDRARSWNQWTEEELLLQFAGHLRGRALQEWNLLETDDKSTYEGAISALRSRIDPGERTLAAQDFRHMFQKDTEQVADFIRRLEKTFRIAYGHEKMSSETRDMLLLGQLQEGLRYEPMRGPTVSGAPTYKALCLAAKNEERRLADLRKRVQYRNSSSREKSPIGRQRDLPTKKTHLQLNLKGGHLRSVSFATRPDTSLGIAGWTDQRAGGGCLTTTFLLGVYTPVTRRQAPPIQTLPLIQQTT